MLSTAMAASTLSWAVSETWLATTWSMLTTRLTRRRGQLLALNALSSHKRGALARLLPSGSIDESKVIGKKEGFDVFNVFGVSSKHPEVATEFWARVPAYLEAGAIKPLSYVVKHAPGLDPGPVNEVLDSYRDGKSITKTHITF